MSFSIRLKQARSATGKPQRAIAEALGVSVQAVSQWENDQSTIQPERIDQLAQILGVDPEWLAGRTPKNRGLSNISARAEKNAEDDKGPLGVLRLRDAADLIKKNAGIDEVDGSFISHYIFVDRRKIIRPAAIIIETDALSPDLTRGDIAIFDLAQSFQTGEIVLVLFAMGGFIPLGSADEYRQTFVPAIARFDPTNPTEPAKMMIDLEAFTSAHEAAGGRTPAAGVLGPLVERRTFPRSSTSPLDNKIK